MVIWIPPLLKYRMGARMDSGRQSPGSLQRDLARIPKQFPTWWPLIALDRFPKGGAGRRIWRVDPDMNQNTVGYWKSVQYLLCQQLSRSIDMTTSILGTPLNLPCGATLPNRLAKAAMSEGP